MAKEIQLIDFFRQLTKNLHTTIPERLVSFGIVFAVSWTGFEPIEGNSVVRHLHRMLW